MFIETTQTIQPLSDGLTLKSIHTLEDVERWAQFQAQIHGEGVAEMSRALLLDHPATRPDHWLFIEEDATQQIVSALCLISWQWRCEEVMLKAGEVGIVATLEAFRNRGLSRALTRHHHKLLNEGGYHLSPIQGIPYFYRQFGYEYALPLEGGSHLELRDVRDGENGCTFRPAAETDIPALMSLYEDAARDLAISACRGEAEWRYLLTHSRRTEMAADYFVILDASGASAGYLGVQQFGFSEGLNVAETSRLTANVAADALRFLKTLAVERGKPFIRLIVPDHTALHQIGRVWGAKSAGRYAWQMHIPNVSRLITAIAPVLERRIAQSAFAGLTDSVHINLYREGIRLHVTTGKITQVEAIVGAQFAAINLPPMAFTQLVLGWRSMAQLSEFYPDASAMDHYRALVDVLFPKTESFIYSQY